MPACHQNLTPLQTTLQQQSDVAPVEGILLLDKPRGKSSFFLVSFLRKILNISKIGHAGTLDPFATGVMVMLVGRGYTKRSNEFLCSDKEYLAKICLGVTTDSYDLDGKIIAQSDVVPTLADLENAIALFQGDILQIPPMFSAKKVNGQKLYNLARCGKEIERSPNRVHVSFSLLDYHYPYVTARICCSKGTYIRSLAHDLGVVLQSGAHLEELQRTRSGSFSLSECLDVTTLTLDKALQHLRQS